MTQRKTGRVRRTMSARDAASEAAPAKPQATARPWDQVAISLSKLLDACTDFVRSAHDEFEQDRSKK